jgi:CopG family transcriptional regulator, nickel-responsive regulator
LSKDKNGKVESRISKLQSNNKGQKNSRKSGPKRISMSLPSELLSEFNRSMVKVGFPDRSKAIQRALYSFIDENNWKTEDDRSGAGAIIMLYNNQNTKSTQMQHKYNDVISSTIHMHLDGNNCLETIMVRGKAKIIKHLVKDLSKNRGIKSLKVHFVSSI